MLLGKINIVKSLSLSKLIFNASVLPSPEDFAKRVDAGTFDFIWDGKPHKIKKTTLIAIKKNMIQFTSMNKSLKSIWVK